MVPSLGAETIERINRSSNTSNKSQKIWIQLPCLVSIEGACRVYSTVRRVCCVVFPVFWILFIADVSCLLCVLLFDRAPRATVPIVPVPVEHSVWELMYLFVGVNDAPKLPPTYVLLYGSRNWGWWYPAPRPPVLGLGDFIGSKMFHKNKGGFPGGPPAYLGIGEAG